MATVLNNIGLDIRTWGGNVDGGAYNLTNVTQVSAKQGFCPTSTVSYDPGDGSGSGLRIGYNTGLDAGYVLAHNTGVAGKNLILGLGNIGIGINAPTVKVDVRGGQYGSPATSGSAASASNHRIGSAGHGEVLDFGNSGGAWIQSRNETNYATNYDLSLQPNGGNVGIGTMSPTAKLHVSGLASYASNAAAITGGLTTGAFYRNGDNVCVVH